MFRWDFVLYHFCYCRIIDSRLLSFLRLGPLSGTQLVLLSLRINDVAVCKSCHGCQRSLLIQEQPLANVGFWYLNVYDLVFQKVSLWRAHVCSFYCSRKRLLTLHKKVKVKGTRLAPRPRRSPTWYNRNDGLWFARIDQTIRWYESYKHLRAPEWDFVQEKITHYCPTSRQWRKRYTRGSPRV